jgi:nucleoside-diphosphate-sugar epimerase
VVFRTPFIVGEHQKEMNVVREFIDSASRGGELLIFGEGKHVREFIHPTDLVSAFDLALRKMDAFERKFEILVLGNKSVAIRDVATIVAKRVGKGTVAYKKTAVDRAFNQYSDYSKAEKLLGWKPKLQLEAIVDRVVSSDFS